MRRTSPETKTHVLQLTDLHLLADEEGTVNQVPTRKALVEVIATCRATGLNFDHLILTGDLAHDEARDTYRVLRDLVTPLGIPFQIIPGNHDCRRFIREAFPEFPGSADEPITFSVPAGSWRLIGIDSQIPGISAGEVNPDQLEWLRNELEKHADAPTLVFVHHPPLPIESEWVQRMGLRNQDKVLKILQAAPQVRAISSGHIHRAASIRAGGIDVFCTPSTAYQYDKKDGSVVLDPLPPGCRVFSLGADGYETDVLRTPRLDYPAGKEADSD